VPTHSDDGVDYEEEAPHLLFCTSPGHCKEKEEGQDAKGKAEKEPLRSRSSSFNTLLRPKGNAKTSATKEVLARTKGG